MFFSVDCEVAPFILRGILGTVLYMASRHLSRMSALQALFAADVFGDLSLKHTLLMLENNSSSLEKQDEDTSFTVVLLKGIIAKRDELDAVIKKAAPQWPLEKIATIDRNILRIGLYELLFGGELAVPPKVALNESIELAKSFGGDSSSRFVNGVLGGVYRDLGSPRKDEAPKKEEKEYLAGIMVCASYGGELYVALVKDPFDTWTLPKTHYTEGELSDTAAMRVAREELGLEDVVLQAPLSEHEYDAHEPKAGVVRKKVGYFLACSKKTPLSKQKGKHVLDAQWFNVDALDEITMYDDLRNSVQSGILVAQSTCI